MQRNYFTTITSLFYIEAEMGFLLTEKKKNICVAYVAYRQLEEASGIFLILALTLSNSNNGFVQLIDRVSAGSDFAFLYTLLWPFRFPSSISPI